MCKMPPKYGPWYQPRLFIKDSWSNAYWFLRQFSFRCRWQRIGDCFRTMWVLSFPNYCPTKLVPPTSNNISSTYFPSHLSSCYSSRQIFPKANVLKPNRRLGGESWKISDGRVSRKMDFTRSQLCPTVLPWEFTVTKVDDIVEEGERRNPAFEILTLEAWGPPGAPARLPQFDWFVSRWLAVRPNRRPVKIPAAVVFQGRAATAPIPPSPHWKAFGLHEPLPTLFRERPLFPEIANNGTFVKPVKMGQVDGATLLNSLRVVFSR